MQRRATERIVPELSNYVTLDVDGQPHPMRIPDAIAGLSALRGIGSRRLAMLGSLDRSVPSMVLALLEQTGPEVLGALCYLIGVAWRHPHLDLDTDTSNRRDTIAIGRDVLVELEDGGYTIEQVVTMGAALVGHWSERNAAGAAALERADFFGPTKASQNSAKSTSTSGSEPTSNGVSET
jgi:hypothetical protein